MITRRLVLPLLAVLALAGFAAPARAAVTPDLLSRAHTFVWGTCKATASFPDGHSAKVVQNSATGTCNYLAVRACATDATCGNFASTDKPILGTVLTSSVGSKTVAVLTITLASPGYGSHQGTLRPNGAYTGAEPLSTTTASEPLAVSPQLLSRSRYFTSGHCTAIASFVDNYTAKLSVTSPTVSCKYIQVQAVGITSCGCLYWGPIVSRLWPPAYTYLESRLPTSARIFEMIIKLDDGVYGQKAWHFFPDGSYY